MTYDIPLTDDDFGVLFVEREMIVALGEDTSTVESLPGDLLQQLYPEFFIFPPQLRYEIFKLDQSFPLTGETLKLIYFIVVSNERNYGRQHAQTETLTLIPFLRNMESVASSCNELSHMIYSKHLTIYTSSLTETTNDLQDFSKTIAEFLPRRPYFSNKAENEAFAAAMLLCLNPHLLNCFPENIRFHAEALRPQFDYILKNFEGFVLHGNKEGTHE